VSSEVSQKKLEIYWRYPINASSEVKILPEGFALCTENARLNTAAKGLVQIPYALI